MKDIPDKVTLFVNGKELQLTLDVLRDLESLRQSPGWLHFQQILATLVEGSVRELEAEATPLDSIRYLQGRLSVARELTRLIERDLPAWVGARNSTRKDT